ncbi:MAG: biotin--[acetyl-CoA-carboxylase] ligase [Thermomicrobiales bacterium]|nr:biotin--[acetyl-CoA-carboxylase] ligase [Thermomicrobiales bacterium]MCO5228014.1 biotin--[acetyl-CoA-carboxylase] ligase [Thermomicrobiales bacterium]
MIGDTRWRFPEVDSTQNIAFSLASMGASPGTTVRAEYQRAGRGRLGRGWDVPPSTSLMFSVLLRPEHQLHELGSLSLALADALAGVFAEIIPDEIAIKWPNDIMINGRKVSGILVQTRMQPELVAVLGIGVNVLQSADQLPEGATSLMIKSGSPIDREHLFERIIESLKTTLSHWRPTLAADVQSRIEQRLWLNGDPVQLLDGDRSINGVIIGIAPTGELRLMIDGEERLISSGEITRGPRAFSR